MKKTIIIAFAAIATMASCKKETVERVTPTPTQHGDTDWCVDSLTRYGDVSGHGNTVVGGVAFDYIEITNKCTGRAGKFVITPDTPAEMTQAFSSDTLSGSRMSASQFAGVQWGRVFYVAQGQQQLSEWLGGSW